MSKPRTPLHFPHPGEILQSEFLDPLGITQYRLAIDLKIPHSRVTALIHGRRSVSPDTALRLSRYFGTTPGFWLGLQQEFDLRKAHKELGKAINSQITPLSI